MLTHWQAVVIVNLFYDGREPPSGIFDDFLSLPALLYDVKTHPFLEIVKSSDGGQTQNASRYGPQIFTVRRYLISSCRGIYNTISHLDITETLIRAVINETNVRPCCTTHYLSDHHRMQFRSALHANDSLLINGYVFEPFLPEAFTRNRFASAYPPYRSENVHPMAISYSWADEKYDDVFMATSRATSEHLSAVAKGEGILATSAKYPNYAIAGTPLQELYGHHVGRLRAIKGNVDPKNIMGLAGGWRL